MRWLLYFIPALLVELLCYITNPLACIFVRREVRLDRVKRLNNRQVTMMRDYPIRLFSLWNTHDNAIDEWWYGAYNDDSYFNYLKNATQADYDNSWLIRYLCRVHWLMRNNAYGWLYKFFSVPVEPMLKWRTSGQEDKTFWYSLTTYPNSFQLEMQIPLGARFFSINIGWKAHKGFPRKMYANRIIGFRKYKKG